MTATAPPTASPPPLVPPDESTWRRYSAQKEGEMSWVSSGTLHILVIGVLLALGWLIKEQHNLPPTNDEGLKNLFRKHRQAMAKPVVMDSDNPNALGSGDPNGPGGVAALGQNNRPDARNPGINGESLVDKTPTKLDPVDATKWASKLPDFMKDTESGRRLIQNGEADDRILGLHNLNEKVKGDLEALDRAQQGTTGEPKQGGNPNGSTGGDPNKGGDPKGGGRGSPARTEKQKRSDRWTLHVDMPTNLNESQYIELYLRKLHALGIFIAIPTDPVGKTPFRVIHDIMQRPVQAVAENPSKLSNVNWYVGDPDNPNDKGYLGKAIAKHLGLSIPFGYIMLVPKPLEDTMAQLENDHLPPGASTDDIHRTHFRIIESDKGFTVGFDHMQMKGQR